MSRVYERTQTLIYSTATIKREFIALPCGTQGRCTGLKVVPACY